MTPGATYALSESGGDPRYVQQADPNAVPIPGSTVSWSCVEVDAAGNVIPGFSDGLNGGVTVPIGTFVRCTAINETATLDLIKNVVNDNGGTAVPADWQLTATPAAARLPRADAGDGHRLDRRHGLRGAAGPGLRADRDRPGRLHARPIDCTIELGDAAADDDASRSTPARPASASSRTTTSRGHLTLVKTVDNGTTGGDGDADRPGR